MSSAEGWRLALLVAAAVHAGFQLTVTCLVYPALAAAPAVQWAATHRGHSRRITPLVAVVYLPLLVIAAGSLLNGPTVAGVVAVTAVALVFAVTAFVAAPLHGRLGAGHDTLLLRRLLAADRIRSVGAVVALVAAGVAVAA